MRKKKNTREKHDTATLGMQIPDGSCGGVNCSNPPAFAIGKLLVCADCLERMKEHYPNSFARYWQHKVVPIAMEDAA